MSENGTPVLRVSGTLTEKDYLDALRVRCLRRLLLLSGLYLGIMAVFTLVSSLYVWFPYLRDGRALPGDWLRGWLDSLFPTTACIFIAVVVFMTAYLLLYVPFRATRRFRELYPGSSPCAYDFFEDILVFSVTTRSSDETFRLRYADVRRGVAENRYAFILTTGQRNRIQLYKSVMTPEETVKVREFLLSRCPRRRKRG